MKKLLIVLGCVSLSHFSFAWVNPQAVLVPPSVNVSTAPAAGTAGTVTLSTPSAGAFSSGYFNYVTDVHIDMYPANSSIAGGNGGKPVYCTSTNLPGSPQWMFSTVVTSGTVITEDFQYANPLQGTQGSQVQITCPAATNASWNINVGYYQGQ